MNAQNNAVSNLGKDSTDSDSQLPFSTIQGDSMQINHEDVTPTPSTSGRQAKRSRSESEAEPADMEPQMKIPRTKEDIKEFIKTVKEIRDQIKSRYKFLKSIRELFHLTAFELTGNEEYNRIRLFFIRLQENDCRTKWQDYILKPSEIKKIYIVAITAAFGSTLTQLITEESRMLEVIKFYSKHFPAKGNKNPQSILKKLKVELSNEGEQMMISFMAAMSGKFETGDIGEFNDNLTSWANTRNIEEQPDFMPGMYHVYTQKLIQLARREIPHYTGPNELMLEVIRELEK